MQLLRIVSFRYFISNSIRQIFIALVQLRLKAVKNIGKITNSMKMIASTKLNRAQKAMEMGRSFAITSQRLFKHLGLVSQSDRDYTNAGDEASLGKTVDKEGLKLVFVCSSDRGLCGAIHSSVSKAARRLAAKDRSGTKIVVIGEKAKPQISRDSRKNIVMHFNQLGRNIPTFTDAAAVWTGAKSSLENWDELSNLLIYNRFISAISFESVIVPLIGAKDILASERLSSYECDRGIIANLAEYMQVCRLYWAFVEGHAAEMSSKRTAMENATKNSEAMVNALTMKYNRTRQAVITNELVDIITGASAL